MVFYSSHMVDDFTCCVQCEQFICGGEDEDGNDDDEHFVSTVLGVAGKEVHLQVFSNELQCDCYVGLEGGFMCPCKIVAASRFRPEAKNM
jgi:hypothetical protein